MVNIFYYVRRPTYRKMEQKYSEFGRANRLPCGGVILVNHANESILQVNYFADTYDRGCIYEITRNSEFEEGRCYDELLNQVMKQKDIFIAI